MRLSQLRSTEEELTKEIKRALARADKIGIPRTEQAAHLKVHRTTLYRAYH